MRRKYYTVEIEEATCSWEESDRVYVHVDGHTICFAGDNAQNLIDILKGERTITTNEDMVKALKEKDRQIDILNGQIKEYKNTNARLKREKENQKNTIREYREEKENLQRKCENQRDTIVELQNTVESLKESVGAKVEEIYILQHGRNNMKQVIKEQLETIETLKAKNAWLIKENSNTALCEKLEKADAEVLYQKNKNKELEKMYNAQCKVVKDQADKIEELKVEIDTLNVDKKTLCDMYDGRSEFIIEQKKEKDKLIEEYRLLKNTCVSVENENIELRKRNRELEQIYKEQAEEIDELTSKIYDLKDENHRHCKCIEDLDSKLLARNARIKELEKAHMDLRNRLDVGTKYMDNLEKRIEDQKTTIDILEKSHAEAMGEKDKEIRDLKQHNEWLTHNVTIGEKVKYAVDNMKLKQETQKLRGKNHHLQVQNARFRDACINAGNRLKELHTYLTSIDEE